MNRIDPEPQTLTLRESVQGVPVSIDIAAGDQWTNRMQAGPLIFNVLPQFVIWAEDEAGNLLDTVYITGASFKGFRHAGREEKGAQFFEESFPVWARRAKAAGHPLPSKEEPYPDTVTSATPTADVAIGTKLPSLVAPFSLFLEVNKSGDENAVFTKEDNDWAGQPSLIYAAEIPEIVHGRAYEMELIGHGGRLRDDPEIYSDLSDFDTALNVVDTVEVRFE